MYASKLKTRYLLCALAYSLALAGCGGGGGDESANANVDAPVTLEQSVATAPAIALAFSGVEDSAVPGTMSKGALQGDEHEFEIVDAPVHGSVRVTNEYTGDFVYTPDHDYFGSDTFSYRVVKTDRQPVRGKVTLDIANVNDAPTLAAIDDMMNSAETHDTLLSLPVTEPDQDVLQVTVSSDDETVAAVSGDGQNRTIRIIPGARGSTKIHVRVNDAEFSSQQEFEFTVGDVEKLRDVATDMAAGQAITFTNVSDQPVPVRFKHNGFPLFQSDQEIVDYVAQLPEQVPGESFPRKLWRFIRDSTYHNVPLTTEQWFHDKWAVLVSQGWGFCSHVTAAYVQLARKAGFEARTWGLTGHVVPEVKIGNEWQVFDPDLSIYYFNSQSKLASVADLTADPSLITAPVDPVMANYQGLQYSQMIADFYGSPSNNFIGDNVFLSVEPGEYQPFVLPPHSRFTYPGRWTADLEGVDGPTHYQIPYYLQGQLLTRMGWTGTVSLPWMIWEIRGTGRVRVLGQEYQIGSSELAELLQRPGRQIPSVEILSATSDIRFVMFMNAMRYGLNATNQVSLTGLDVWAVQVGTRLLADESRPNPNGAIVYKKPSF